MADAPTPGSFAARLLDQDPPPDAAAYAAYRAAVDAALARAGRRQQWAGRVVVASLVISLALMFVGGSGVIGDFDPYAKGATPLSIAAGVVYVLATGTFFVSLASYYSRFRPGVRAAEERARDLAILDLRRQLAEIRARQPDPLPPPPD